MSTPRPVGSRPGRSPYAKPMRRWQHWLWLFLVGSAVTETAALAYDGPLWLITLCGPWIGGAITLLMTNRREIRGFDERWDAHSRQMAALQMPDQREGTR